MSLEPQEDNFIGPDLDECSESEMDDEFKSFVSESAGDQFDENDYEDE